MQGLPPPLRWELNQAHKTAPCIPVTSTWKDLSSPSSTQESGCWLFIPPGTTGRLQDLSLQVPALICLYIKAHTDRYKVWAPPQQSAYALYSWRNASWNPPSTNYEAICELMLIPGNVCAKKCIIWCHVKPPGRTLTAMEVTPGAELTWNRLRPTQRWWDEGTNEYSHCPSATSLLHAHLLQGSVLNATSRNYFCFHRTNLILSFT